ncbi:MAG TPA: AraC family transcriptional regulator [Herpetosiphon sp.]|uniref:Transcriptional regulator, AraC family n=1 Tax=Herpetosiphon aurantiacus (strain ATCC 23779 / DSM 785 / 114-95) TaxID=316274 RepID=A9AXZ2_HERA2|nr:helix-turn-helix domain-containing protein [Herpetosiphon sp.]ABX04958.1 transcriptional regulator, AraC family [Herpetosiphon aurantiacus DSM 785]HBW50397.1 AraC family transcriptional regulator [Herpetosiphon sp.]
MSLVSLPVNRALRPLIRSIVLHQAHGSEASAYPVLPTPFPVAGIQYQGRLGVHQQPTNTFKHLNRLGLTGLQSTIRQFQPDQQTQTILLVFQPYGVFASFKHTMADLHDQHVPLHEFIAASQLEYLIEQIDTLALQSADLTSVAELVSQFVYDQLMPQACSPHASLINAVNILLAAKGTYPISQLAREVNLSRRQLERLFKQQIGLQPKAYASLVQFDQALRSLAKRNSWASLAHDSGYADQAHFIRQFAARVGQSPAAYAATSKDVAFLQSLLLAEN